MLLFIPLPIPPILLFIPLFIVDPILLFISELPFKLLFSVLYIELCSFIPLFMLLFIPLLYIFILGIELCSYISFFSSRLLRFLCFDILSPLYISKERGLLSPLLKIFFKLTSTWSTTR